MVIAEIGFLNASCIFHIFSYLDIILYRSKLWSFDIVFWMRYKVFHNLCRGNEFSFYLFLTILSDYINKIIDSKRVIADKVRSSAVSSTPMKASSVLFWRQRCHFLPIYTYFGNMWFMKELKKSILKSFKEMNYRYIYINFNLYIFRLICLMYLKY